MSAYKEGYESYSTGAQNPYAPDTDQCVDFEDGRDDAALDDFYQYDDYEYEYSDHEEDEY